MSDILELIKERRNIKDFIPKFVSWENLSRIIDAARHAPSCGNIQNWKFIVIIEPDLKVAVAKICQEQFEIAKAGALIVVCGEPEKAERYYGERGEKFYSIQNCAAAMQNMLLEAHSIGIGTRWVGAFDDEELRSLLSIPEGINPQAVIAVGYAKEVPPKPPKYPLETLVYFHKWRNRIRDPAKYMNDTATILGRKAAAAKESLKKKVKETTQAVVEKIKGEEGSEEAKIDEN